MADSGAELVLTNGRATGRLPAETAGTPTSFTIFEGTSEIFLAIPIVELFAVHVAAASAKFDARIGLCLLYVQIEPATPPRSCRPTP